MEGLDILKIALHDGLFVGIGKTDGKAEVKLIEKDKGAKLREVTLTNLPIESIVLKLDKTPIHRVFKGKGPNKRCDYLILTKLIDKDIALFIEMKSTNYDEDDCLAKFKGTECLMNYCNSVLYKFYNKKNVISKFDNRFVIFYKTSINKHLTRQKRIAKNDTPENAFLYPDPHVVSIEWLIL